MTLTPPERNKAREAATALSDKYAKLPSEHKRDFGADTSTPDSWYHSLKAEMAVAKHFGLVPPTWEIFQGMGDKDVDLHTASGKRVQVKYRRQHGRDLALRSTDARELKPDYYVLVYPGYDDDTAEIAGWCTRDEFLERIFSRPPVRMVGLKYEMMPSELHSPEEALPA